MFDLDKLYKDHKSKGDNPLCDGCTVLQSSKPCYSFMDYEDKGTTDVLFLSDSFRHKLGKLTAFTGPERSLIRECFGEGATFSASIKCPSVKEGDMSPDNLKICRQHLEATIDSYKPKLVFPCGNLAMKMLIRKSGISNKRGSAYEHTTEAGHSCIVVPIFHPYSVIQEPRHKFLFQTDIRNAYEKYVLCKENKDDFSYNFLEDIDDVVLLSERLRDSKETLAIDIETTGLNFLKDKIQTIAFSSEESNWVIPLDHKDSPFKKGESYNSTVIESLKRILENPHNKKVFHNAKFDLKFLLSYGIHTKNVWDTKIMHHLLDENLPKSLMDLVKLYFPSELESL